MEQTKEFKYCIKKLRKIYPHVKEEALEMMTGMILITVASADLNEAINKLQRRGE